MNLRYLFCASLACLAFPAALFAGGDKEVANESPAPVTPAPFTFQGEFLLEQSYVGESDVARENFNVNDFDELYSHARFVYTPRTKYGIIRAGVEYERYSFGFSESGGHQLPNTLQEGSLIVGFDTKFSDSILVRLEAQPGFYGTSFDRFDINQFNVPLVFGSTYIYSPTLQFVGGVSLNFERDYPVLPGGGVRWKFAPKWVLDGVLPTPQLQYEVVRDVTAFVGADIKANTFKVDNRFGDRNGDTSLNGAYLDYEEVRIGAGVNWKLSSFLSLRLEGGYVPYRQFDYHRTEVRYHNQSGAPYGSILLQGSF